MRGASVSQLLIIQKEEQTRPGSVYLGKEMGRPRI